MNLGIWTLDYSINELQKLKDEGFDGLFLPMGYFWDIQGSNPTYEKAIFWMKHWYEETKKMGFKFFLIDFGWGLGKYDGNYTYKKVYEAFKDSTDVMFYCGEFYESFYETGKYTLEQVEDILSIRANLVGADKLIADGTVRSIGRPYIHGLSSYWNQEKYWSWRDKIAWIYGQVKFDANGSYENKAKIIKNIGLIEIVFLYQADSNKFSIKEPYTWLNWLYARLGIENKMKHNKRIEFIKYFGAI